MHSIYIFVVLLTITGVTCQLVLNLNPWYISSPSALSVEPNILLSRPPNRAKASRPYLKPRKRRPRSSSKLDNVSTASPSFLENRSDYDDSHIDRVQKLKDARSEAEREIVEYKQSKEAEFKAFESTVCHIIHLVDYPFRTLPFFLACRHHIYRSINS